MTAVHVPGKNSGDIMLYALSTCGWCQKTRKLLGDLGVEYSYVYVDDLVGRDREKAISEIRAWNPSMNFPTIVIGNKRCIVGFKEDEIREALGK
jgi:glutaredoxin